MVVIDGMAGVGKTSLAVRAAHQLAHRGGATVRLRADLRGYDADRAPADPLAVLEGFLRQLGVPGGEIRWLSPAGGQETYRQLPRQLPCRQPRSTIDPSVSDLGAGSTVSSIPSMAVVGYTVSKPLNSSFRRRPSRRTATAHVRGTARP